MFSGRSSGNAPKLLNYASYSFLSIMEKRRCSTVGFLYPPGLRCISMNSMSFLMIALGS